MSQIMQRALSIIVLTSVLVSACGGAQSVVIQTPTPAINNCDTAQVKAAGDQLQKLLARLQDAVKVAESTGRGALSGPVANLQAIKRDTSDLAVPKCLDAAKQYLVDSMSATADGFLAFMAQKADSITQSYFTNSTTLLSAYTDEVQRVTACAPDCK